MRDLCLAILLGGLPALAQGPTAPFPFVPQQTGGGGTPTQVETFNVALPNTVGGPATATFLTPTVAGELIVVGGGGTASGASLTSCTDSNSDVFTSALLQVVSATSGGGWVQLLYFKNTVSGITTVTCTESSGVGRMFVAHVKGLANNGTLDQNAAAFLPIQSGTYVSGITAVGTATQTCSLTAFNNSCTGATATVPLTGTNTIAGSTALTITSGGAGTCTAAATGATAGNGTATCTGSAVLSTVVLGPLSPWNSLPVTTTVPAEYLAGVMVGAFNGANCAPSSNGSWTQDQHTNNLGGTGWTSAYAHQIVSTIQTNIENTGTDTASTCQHWALIAAFN